MPSVQSKNPAKKEIRSTDSPVPQDPARFLGGNLGTASVSLTQVSVRNRREPGAPGTRPSYPRCVLDSAYSRNWGFHTDEEGGNARGLLCSRGSGLVGD